VCEVGLALAHPPEVDRENSSICGR
jgi:hypothetical protein